MELIIITTIEDDMDNRVESTFKVPVEDILSFKVSRWGDINIRKIDGSLLTLKNDTEFYFR